MKTLKLLVYLLFFPLVFHAQNTLTGLWTGTLENDSNTIRKDQTFEIVLTQYKNKVYGYSRMNFIVNDTLYYIVKRVKGTIEDDLCEVKDDHIIAHNFPKQPEKGVKLTTTFRRSQQDSIWRLDGDWKTKEVLRRRYGYYSISGKITLKSEPDLEKSKLFPHLEELNLANDVAFYKESKQTNQSTIANYPTTTAAVSNKQETKKNAEVAKTEKPASSTSPAEQNNNGITETIVMTANSQEAISKKEDAIQEPDPQSTSLKKSDLPAATMPAEQKKEVAGINSRPEVKKQELPVKKVDPDNTAHDADLAKTTIKKSDLITTAKTDDKKLKSDPKEIKVNATAAAFVQERKMIAPQVVTFKSDSLELSLYDNGEIDGDTVSLLLNGTILLARQGLKGSAIKKTIYIQHGDDEVNLVLYAENLGKYPPNTGLLVVHDGEDVYQLRFSADLQQNAAVVFRRKK